MTRCSCGRFAASKRNLHRVWLETLASNERGLRAYRAVGFVEEGRLRQHARVDGGWVDVVVMGVLRHEADTDRRVGHAAGALPTARQGPTTTSAS